MSASPRSSVALMSIVNAQLLHASDPEAVGAFPRETIRRCPRQFYHGESRRHLETDDAPPVFTPCVDDVIEPVSYQPASRPAEFAMSGNGSDDRAFPPQTPPVEALPRSRLQAARQRDRQRPPAMFSE